MKKTTARGSFALFILLFAFMQGCLGPVKELYPRDTEERTVSVYIVSHGRHAGIAFQTEDIAADLWVRDETLPPVRFLEIGWGDSGWYQTPQKSLGLLVRASFWPTPSILHVAGFNAPVPVYFSASQVVEVRISEAGMRELMRFIAGYFQTDEDGLTISTGRGLYGTHSSFYKAGTRYYLPKTSNTWTARALRSAGAPVTPLYGLTSGNVMYQARRIGTVVGE